MELITSTTDFFQQVVGAAMTKHDVRLQDATRCYLINLLTERTASRVDDEPLSLKLAQARQAAPLEQLRLLQQTGDTALYLCGFFAESLSRRLVSVEYYIELGGAAYGQLARAGTLVSALVCGVFDELAAQFPRLVGVLAETRNSLNIHSSRNELRLYKQWLETRSEHLGNRLRSAGFVLPNSDETN